MTISDRENLNIEFHPNAAPETVPKEAALCVYRIAQESLRNIAKHAHAHNVEVSLRQCGASLCLEVIDDGVGFAPKSVRHTPGIGLASMRERVQFAKGEFTIRSEPGTGTTVAVAVPIEGSAS
jgi:signal transduction histidine kinase